MASLRFCPEPQAQQPCDPTRRAAIVTFLARATGLSLLGVGSAFWGLVAGVVALAARRILAPRGPTPPKA
jgi:benzoate membrane transport protein